MSASLENLLITVGFLAIGVLTLLLMLLMQRVVRGWSSSAQQIEIVKVPALSAKDNVYTELAAGKQVTAAEKSLAAQHVALEVAKIQERTEDKRLERVRLEKQGSA